MHPQATPASSRLGKVWGVIVVVLLADQLIKWLVNRFIPPVFYSVYTYPYGGLGVFRNFFHIEFSINHLTNTGAAWGIGSSFQLLLLIVRIFLITGLCFYLFYWNHRSLWNIPLALIIAGAASNVLDFFFYGHVIDMFHFVIWNYDFPTFNLADSAISIGIALLFFLNWLSPEEKKTSHPHSGI